MCLVEQYGAAAVMAPMRAAEAIAASAAGASAARRSISRDAVGSHATDPSTSGGAQLCRIGHTVPADRQAHGQIQQNPARIWLASGSRHRATDSESALSGPTTSAARRRVTAVCGTTIEPCPPTARDGCRPLRFLTRKVLPLAR